jgi:hypothetical protein
VEITHFSGFIYNENKKHIMKTNLTHARMDEEFLQWQIQHLRETEAAKILIDKKILELKTVQRQRKIEDLLYAKFN